MALISSILAQLDLGNSVAESDLNLQEYFLETQPFRELIGNRRDVIGGDKGTGKTALYKILQSNYSSYKTLGDVDVVPAFNPTGSPVFVKLAARGALQEGEYVNVWKAYILATAGNWLLNTYTDYFNDEAKLLNELLTGLDFRTPNQQTRNIFDKIINGIGNLFRWKKAEVEFNVDVVGKFAVIPRVEAQDASTPDRTPAKSVPVEVALQVLEDCLAAMGRSVWIALDRLDEAFQGSPEIEIPALRALLKSYLDLREFPHIRVKLFLRKDLFRRITEDSQFVNLTHINSSKVDIFWNDEDLKNLLLKRVKKNRSFMDLMPENLSDKDLFDIIFPDQVDQGSRKPKTWVWIMRRVRDGNNVKPPRNVIDLVLLARDEQLKREDRAPREWNEGESLIEPEALKAALSQLSENRVQDTLLAEAGNYARLIRKFEGSWAEHNEESLALALTIGTEDVKKTIKPIIELGFLEFIRATGTYKIPAIYRSGLSITQGKAFTELHDEADEDDL